MKKKNFPLVATLVTLIAIAALCGLGKWQLDRLAWKTEILKKLDAEYAKDAANTFYGPADLAQDFDFRRGTLHGVYDYSKQILLGPRVWGNLPGYHVLTPLKLEDGSYILVNRGWVPQEWRVGNELVKGPGETVAVTGLLRKPSERNPFTPENAPAQNQWYFADTNQIAAAKDLGEIPPYILFLEGNGTDNGEYPLAAATKPEIDNNHLQYAVFWFIMAGAVVVIYVLRFLKSA